MSCSTELSTKPRGQVPILFYRRFLSFPKSAEVSGYFYTNNKQIKTLNPQFCTLPCLAFANWFETIVIGCLMYIGKYSARVHMAKDARA